MASDDPRDDDVASDAAAAAAAAAADTGASAAPNDDAPHVPQAPPPRRRGFLRRHWLGLLVFFLIAIPAGGFFLWVTATLGYSYSSGERAGYNQKLSRRGWLCKTWEGELAISSVPGVMPELFRYTVRSDSLAHAIQSLSGQRVTLYYEQHIGVPTSCFGDSEYFVIGVK